MSFESRTFTIARLPRHYQLATLPGPRCRLKRRSEHRARVSRCPRARLLQKVNTSRGSRSILGKEAAEPPPPRSTASETRGVTSARRSRVVAPTTRTSTAIRPSAGR